MAPGGVPRRATAMSWQRGRERDGSSAEQRSPKGHRHFVHTRTLAVQAFNKTNSASYRGGVQRGHGLSPRSSIHLPISGDLNCGHFRQNAGVTRHSTCEARPGNSTCTHRNVFRNGRNTSRRESAATRSPTDPPSHPVKVTRRASFRPTVFLSVTVGSRLVPPRPEGRAQAKDSVAPSHPSLRHLLHADWRTNLRTAQRESQDRVPSQRLAEARIRDSPTPCRPSSAWSCSGTFRIHPQRASRQLGGTKYPVEGAARPIRVLPAIRSRAGRNTLPPANFAPACKASHAGAAES